MSESEKEYGFGWNVYPEDMDNVERNRGDGEVPVEHIPTFFKEIESSTTKQAGIWDTAILDALNAPDPFS
jgi:hypothetical protein